jgi:hypothetical protein
MSQEQDAGRFVTWPEYLKGHLERTSYTTYEEPPVCFTP